MKASKTFFIRIAKLQWTFLNQNTGTRLVSLYSNKDRSPTIGCLADAGLEIDHGMCCVQAVSYVSLNCVVFFWGGGGGGDND